MARCHSHVEFKYVPCDDLDKLSDEQTKLSADGWDTEVVPEGDGEEEVLKPTRYVIHATRQACECVCPRCGEFPVKPARKKAR